MYTVIAVIIIFFPWTLVGTVLIGWLVQRHRRAHARVDRAQDDLRRAA